MDLNDKIINFNGYNENCEDLSNKHTDIQEYLEILKLAENKNIIDLARIREVLEMKQREQILNEHPYSIWRNDTDGKWYTYIPDKTKKRGKALRKRNTEKEIQDMLIEYWKGRNKEEQKKTFMDIYQQWRLVQDRLVTVNTALKYDSDRVRFFDESAFAKMNVTAITDDDINIFMCETIKKHKLSNETTRKLFGYISNTFFHARKRGIIATNPAEFIKAKDFYRYCYEKYKPVEKRLVTEEDMKKLQAQFSEDHKKKPNYMPTYAVEFASLTGMRVGEIAALRWDHVEENRIVIEFSEKYTSDRKEYWIDRTKNKHYRFFPLTNEIRDFLENLKSIEKKYGYYCEWVFADENGRLHAPVISDCSKAKCRQVNVNINGEQGIRIFRRTLNSNLRSRGVPVATAAAMLGHSVQVNEKYYTFDMMDEKEKVRVLSEINKSIRAV